MTLHQTIDVAKKVLLGVAAGIGVIIIIVIFYQLSIIIKNILFPAQVQQATHLYEKVPSLVFPRNVVSTNFTYTLDTVTGTLPEFPDRLNIFPLVKPQPNFLNLTKAKEKAAKLGFVNKQGIVVPEQRIDTTSYKWTDQNDSQKQLMMSIVNFDFTLDANYLTSPTVLEANNIGNEKAALTTTTTFLRALSLLPNDIDEEKTQNPPKDISYATSPQLFSITNGKLVPTTNLSKTQIIAVNLYQKDMTYKLNTGIPEVTGGFRKIDVTLPIVYPHPPSSTMTLWLGSNGFETEVVAANFFHKSITIEKDVDATYPIKTAEEALETLKNGKAYIASYQGDAAKIKINNIYLAYYLGEVQQSYLMPVIVFEGDAGFFAYVSALRDEWILQ